jgi:hypothetical protein
MSYWRKNPVEAIGFYTMGGFGAGAVVSPLLGTYSSAVGGFFIVLYLLGMAGAFILGE